MRCPDSKSPARLPGRGKVRTVLIFFFLNTARWDCSGKRKKAEKHDFGSVTVVRYIHFILVGALMEREKKAIAGLWVWLAFHLDAFIHSISQISNHPAGRRQRRRGKEESESGSVVGLQPVKVGGATKLEWGWWVWGFSKKLHILLIALYHPIVSPCSPPQPVAAVKDENDREPTQS